MYIDQHCRIIHKVQQWEVLRSPDASYANGGRGTVGHTERRAELPLRWSGVFIDKGEACRKFVFVGKQQLVHVNGLTCDFLFAMARELETKAA